MRFASLLPFLLVVACSSQTARPDASSTPDADTATDLGATGDATATDADVLDAATSGDATLAADGEVPDANAADAAASPCEGAGGACVDDTTFCSDTLGGQVTRIACGPSGGICCLPVSPTCETADERGEGWYRRDESVCLDTCDGLRATPGQCGTEAEGWYTDLGQGCDARTGLVVLDSFACGVVRRAP